MLDINCFFGYAFFMAREVIVPYNGGKVVGVILDDKGGELPDSMFVQTKGLFSVTLSLSGSQVRLA